MDETKQQILNSAKCYFYRFGYHKTSVDEIARDSSVSKKTVYKHFSSKKGLYEAAIRGIAEDERRRYEMEAAGRSYRERFMYVVDAAWTGRLQARRNNQTALSPEILEMTYRIMQEVLAPFVFPLIDEGIQTGELRPYKKAFYGKVFNLLIDGLTRHVVDEGADEAETKEQFDRLIRHTFLDTDNQSAAAGKKGTV